MWQAIKAGSSQVRIFGKTVVGLDAGAVLALGRALGADPGFLADTLIAVEPIIVRLFNETDG